MKVGQKDTEEPNGIGFAPVITVGPSVDDRVGELEVRNVVRTQLGLAALNDENNCRKDRVEQKRSGPAPAWIAFGIVGSLPKGVRETHVWTRFMLTTACRSSRRRPTQPASCLRPSFCFRNRRRTALQWLCSTRGNRQRNDGRLVKVAHRSDHVDRLVLRLVVGA